MESVPAVPVEVKPAFWSKKRVLLFLIFVVFVAVAVILSFLYWQNNSQAARFLGEKIDFTSANSKFKYQEFIKKGFSEQAQDSQAQNLVKAFLVLSVEYQSAPTADKRNLLIQLNDFLVKSFPKEASDAKISVSCFEESCGYKLSYSGDYAVLKDKIESLNVGDSAKKSLLSNLASVVSGVADNNKSAQFNGLAVLFSNLKNQWNFKKDPGIKELAILVAAEMEKVDAQNFKSSQEFIDYELK